MNRASLYLRTMGNEFVLYRDPKNFTGLIKEVEVIKASAEQLQSFQSQMEYYTDKIS